MRKATVAARVAAMDTTMVPEMPPNTRPAVMVKGMAAEISVIVRLSAQWYVCVCLINHFHYRCC